MFFKKKKWPVWMLAVVILMAMGLTACAPGATPPTESGDPPQTTDTEPAPSQTDRVFVDSTGRQVTLPVDLVRMAPSGTLANLVLFTASPDRMNGVSLAFTDSQKKLIDPVYFDLPVMGKFYGKGPDFNLETVLAAGTQVIVDIGENKDSTKSDLDDLMNQIKIPTIFIEALFDTMPQTYRDIGRLIGDSSRTDLLALYCEESLALSERARAEIGEEDRIRVYWALGERGLNTNAVGSFHSELLDRIPVINVADVEPAGQGGGSEVSMEQIIRWNPDLILIDGARLAEVMKEDPAWMSLPAMKEGRIIIVPSQPYGFLADPPSVNRYAGLRWLGATLYPQIYGEDARAEVRGFFDLFYGIQVDDATLDAILDGSFK